MTVATATRGGDRPMSHAIAGGAIADVGVAGLASYAHGGINDSEDATPHFALYFGILAAVDVAGVLLVHHLRGPVEAPPAAKPTAPKVAR
jgi:hypothetical protein